MRIVWKDSCVNEIRKPIKYRGYVASSCDDGGWIIDVPDDDNIYKNHYCALNAIDKYFGSCGERGSEKRKSYGIQVIGKYN